MALKIIRQKALKPKMKSFKVRVQRIKADMGKIREEQRCIREEQKDIKEKFGQVKRQCDQLRDETQLIMQQSTSNRVRLILMFNILRARQDGDLDKAATLTRFLKLVSDRRRL
ncbi:hypothetical protein DITRI_Ditri03aG0003000 [Diplodiscus trichospermus]